MSDAIDVIGSYLDCNNYKKQQLTKSLMLSLRSINCAMGVKIYLQQPTSDQLTSKAAN